MLNTFGIDKIMIITTVGSAAARVLIVMQTEALGFLVFNLKRNASMYYLLGLGFFAYLRASLGFNAQIGFRKE